MIKPVALTIALALAACGETDAPPKPRLYDNPHDDQVGDVPRCVPAGKQRSISVLGTTGLTVFQLAVDGDAIHYVLNYIQDDRVVTSGAGDIQSVDVRGTTQAKPVVRVGGRLPLASIPQSIGVHGGILIYAGVDRAFSTGYLIAHELTTGIQTFIDHPTDLDRLGPIHPGSHGLFWSVHDPAARKSSYRHWDGASGETTTLGSFDDGKSPASEIATDTDVLVLHDEGAAMVLDRVSVTGDPAQRVASLPSEAGSVMKLLGQNDDEIFLHTNWDAPVEAIAKGTGARRTVLPAAPRNKATLLDGASLDWIDGSVVVSEPFDGRPARRVEIRGALSLARDACNLYVGTDAGMIVVLPRW